MGKNPQPKWLQRTDAELAEEARVQNERRAGNTRAHLTDAERLVSRGALLEQTARGNLAAGSPDAMAQLAEALAMQGRYGEAAEQHPNKMSSARYREIADAIQLNDEEKCDCPDTETEELTITPRFSEGTIYSSRHKGAVELVRCSKCGHLNARPSRSRLLLNQSAMNQNLAAIKSGGRGTSDAQLLKKQ